MLLIERGRKVTLCRKIPPLIANRSIEGHPRMLIEPPADHLSVLWPLVQCVERGMHTNKALAIVLDKRDQRGLLFIVQVQLTGRAREDDRIEVVQVLRVLRKLLLRDQLRVR